MEQIKENTRIFLLDCIETSKIYNQYLKEVDNDFSIEDSIYFKILVGQISNPDINVENIYYDKTDSIVIMEMLRTILGVNNINTKINVNLDIVNFVRKNLFINIITHELVLNTITTTKELLSSPLYILMLPKNLEEELKNQGINTIGEALLNTNDNKLHLLIAQFIESVNKKGIDYERNRSNNRR